MPKAPRDDGNYNLDIPLGGDNRKSGDLYPLGGILSKGWHLVSLLPSASESDPRFFKSCFVKLMSSVRKRMSPNSVSFSPTVFWCPIDKVVPLGIVQLLSMLWQKNTSPGIWTRDARRSHDPCEKDSRAPVSWPGFSFPKDKSSVSSYWILCITS